MGSLMSGLTIGLMSLDETTLQVIRNTGDEKQRRYAERIAPIRKDGYMLLVTLILASTVSHLLYTHYM
jgi:metal transporter CNNM